VIIKKINKTPQLGYQDGSEADYFPEKEEGNRI